MTSKNERSLTMKLWSFVLCASFSLLLAMTVQAQQTPPASESSESIEIGGMTLRLGMDQNLVIHSLTENYHLQEIGTATATGSSWMAETKAGPPYVAVASVTFVAGRLSSVYKYRTGSNEPDTDASIAGTLYGAVTKFERESLVPCVVTTNSSQQPAGEVRTVFVTCTGRQKYLSIDIVPTGNGKERVSLAEVLKYPSDEIMVPDQIRVTGAAGGIAPSSPKSTQGEQALVTKPVDKTFASPRDPRTKTDSWVPPDVDQDIPQVTPGAACPLASVLSSAGKRVQELVSNVDKFTATEVLEHQSVDKSGQLRPPEIRKFNYLVSITQTPEGHLDFEEYRDGGTDPYQFPNHIATVGTPSLVLIFHPRHVKDFTMTCEGLGRWQGKPAWQVRFEERKDSGNRMSVFVFGGRPFGLRLRGRAWILADSYQVARLETDLAEEIPQVQLRLQHEDIEYRPVQFDEGKTEMWLPSITDLYMDFRGRRFYRRHRFTDFQLFSVKVQQTLGDLKE